MATYKIPVTSDNLNYRMTVEMDGSLYHLDFRYNDRAGAWFISVYAEDGTEILIGQKLVTDWIVGQYSSTVNLPAGELMVLDATQAGIEATDSNFGSTVVVLYKEA